MASVYTNKKGQWWVGFYYERQHIQKRYPSEQEARSALPIIDREEKISKRQGKPTPYLKGIIQEWKEKQLSKHGVIHDGSDSETIAKFIRNNFPPLTPRKADEVFNEFIAEKRPFIKPITEKAYRLAWLTFREFITEKHIHEITREKILAFIVACKDAENIKGKTRFTPTTINTRIRHLRPVFRYAEGKGYIIKSPFSQKIDELRHQKPRKPFLILDEVNTLMESATCMSKDAHLFIALGIYAGMRAGEIHRAKWSHISNLEALSVTRAYFGRGHLGKTGERGHKERLSAGIEFG